MNINFEDFRVDLYSFGIPTASGWAKVTHEPTGLYSECDSDCAVHEDNNIPSSRRAECAFNKLKLILEADNK